MPGRPLDEVAHALPSSELNGLIEQVGALLARMHGVTTELGVRHGVEVPGEDAVARAARTAHGVGGTQAAEAVTRGAEWLADRVERGGQPQRVFAHGDWLPKHFMIHEGAIAGVIDWEFAGSASPERAFARWEVSARAGLHARSEALRRGYARDGDLDEEWVSAFAIAWALEVLGWRNPAAPDRQARCVEVIARHVV